MEKVLNPSCLVGACALGGGLGTPGDGGDPFLERRVCWGLGTPDLDLLPCGALSCWALEPCAVEKGLESFILVRGRVRPWWGPWNPRWWWKVELGPQTPRRFCHPARGSKLRGLRDQHLVHLSLESWNATLSPPTLGI